MLTSMANISVQPNIVDPDQTAPSGAVRYGSTLIVTKTSFNNELEDNIWVLRKGKQFDLGPHCLLHRQVWNKLAEHIGNDIYV